MAMLRLATLAAGVSASVQVIGRHKVSKDGTVEFDFPGVRLLARVQGASTVSANMSKVGPVEDLFLVYCDGQPQLPGIVPSATFSTAGWSGPVEVELCSNLDSESVHSIEIFKSTEAMWNSIAPQPNQVKFHGLWGEGLKVLPPPPRPARRVEFLGDSITAGYCNLCTDGGVLAQSQAHGWPTLTCQHLDAECHIAAWSGFGMVENCCGGDTTASDIWRRTLGSVPSDDASDVHGTTAENEWDFTAWQARAVVVNLGTNDGLVGDRAALIPSYNSTYLSLVRRAAEAYGPEVHFFLACGPMSDTYCDEVDWVIQQAIALGIKASFLDHRGFAHPDECCGHPSAASDIQIADRTASTIAAALGWSSPLLV